MLIFFPFLALSAKLLLHDIVVQFIVPKNMDFQVPKEFFDLDPNQFSIKIIDFEDAIKGYEDKFEPDIYISIKRGDSTVYIEKYDPTETEYLYDLILLKRSLVIETNREHLENIKNQSYFVLYSDNIPLEYENCAFSNPRTKINFYFINSTDNLLQYYYSPQNKLISMNESTTITEFTSFYTSQIKYSNGYKFIIVSDEYKEDFNEYISQITEKFKSVETDIVSWDDFEPYRELAQVSKAETSYFLLHVTNTTERVWMYPDEDVVSKDSILFFISSGIQHEFSFLKSETDNVPGSLVKKTYNITRDIPSEDCSVLFAHNYHSWSNPQVELVFYEVARKLKRDNVKFFTSLQNANLFPWYIPNFDGFPSIALWKPYDFRPFKYSNKIDAKTIMKWINELCPA